MSAIKHWGSTEAERAERFPCDELLADADEVLFRAVSVAAPPAVVFRWLCQLRVAPYSYDWIDNLGRRSPRELTPGLDELAAGDVFMQIFRLTTHERDRHITLVLERRRDLFGELVCTYRVAPDGEGGSRLVCKTVVRKPRGIGRLFSALLPAGDFVMMRKQLLTIKSLAERG